MPTITENKATAAAPSQEQKQDEKPTAMPRKARVASRGKASKKSASVKTPSQAVKKAFELGSVTSHIPS